MTDHAEANALAVEHMCLVKEITFRIGATLPTGVDREDLEGAGYVGLVQASRSYDDTRGVKFGAYARRRIRGEIFDTLRRADWLPRIERARLKREGIPAPVTMMSLDAGRGTSDCTGHVATLRQMIADHHPRPDHNLHVAEFWASLADDVSDRELRILQMYYRDGMSHRQIGAIFGFTASNTCRILAGIRDRHAS